MNRLWCWLKRDHQWMFYRLKRDCIRCDRHEVFILSEDRWVLAPAEVKA